MLIKAAAITVAAMAVLSMSGPAAHAVSFQIDPFSTPPAGQAIDVSGTGTASSTMTGLAGVVGGARSMHLNVTGSAWDLVSSLAQVSWGPGSLSFSNDSGQDAVGTVTWDQNGLGLGGVDITLGGACQYLQARILASDLNLGFRVDITETAAAGGSTAWWSTNLGAGPSDIFQLLSGFTNAGAVDFTKVDKIALTLSGPTAQDGTIDLLEVTDTPVPEPLTIGGIALGVGALCSYVRRRRASSSCGA